MRDLEKIVEKIKPLVEKSMQEHLGITITELESDISDRMLRLFDVNTKLRWKDAKRILKKQYLVRLLQQFGGNIVEVAKVAKIDRRSIHRLVKEFNIDVSSFRKLHIDYAKRLAVKDIIESSLEQYKGVLSEQKYAAMYSAVPKLSEDIVRVIPDTPSSWKSVEREFEKEYLKKALKENNNNVSLTARKCGLRVETLYRKLRFL